MYDGQLITGEHEYVFDIVPMGAPRMTRADAWRKRAIVLRYFAFRDELNLKANLSGYVLGDMLNIKFYLPFPPSYTKKKKDTLEGMPHQLKPDNDNLVKAFMDGLKSEDCTVWCVFSRKYWSSRPRIVVTI